MILKEYVVIGMFLFFGNIVLSQQRQFKKGNEAFDNLAYAKAIKLYKEAYKKGFTSKELYEKIADSYYFNSNLEKAVFWYKKLIISYSGTINTEHIDRYANSLIAISQYKEANMVKTRNVSDETDVSGLHDAAEYLNRIENLSGRFILDTLSINSRYSDYAPSFYEDQLVFTSSRNFGRATSFIHEWNDEPFLDLYAISNANEVKGLTKRNTSRLKGTINTKFHESSASFTKDKKTVYFTRSNFLHKKVKFNKKGYVLLKIFRAHFDGKKWGNVEELPFNSEEYSVSHPSISSDGRFLYFASDMPGGYGGLDLYVVEIDEYGCFKTPKNLGKPINTSGKETFPYIGDEGRLFFASNKHPGLGGLDVFVARTNRHGNIIIENLGKPINSNKDDFTFIIKEKAKIGYFASNRIGGVGGDDIYGFRQTIPFPKQYPVYRIFKQLEKHVLAQDTIKIQAITSW